MDKKKIIIDTDISMGIPFADVDDGLAILLALNSPELEIKAITKVYGNTTIKKAEKILNELLHKWKEQNNVEIQFQCPNGADKQIKKLFKNPIDIFLNPNSINKLDIKDQKLIDEIKEGMKFPAIRCMAEIINANKNNIILVPIGPLTNIALLFRLFPETIQNINMLSIMGGKLNGYEFNFANDPIATNYILKLPVKMYIAGLEVCEAQMINSDHLKQIKSHNTIVSKFIYDKIKLWQKFMSSLHGFKKSSGFYPYDPCAVVGLIDSQIITYKPKKVKHSIPKVFWHKFNLRSRTTEIQLIDTNEPNYMEKCPYFINWADSINSEKFVELLIKRLS